jgi:hypothetical protein
MKSSAPDFWKASGLSKRGLPEVQRRRPQPAVAFNEQVERVARCLEQLAEFPFVREWLSIHRENPIRDF